MQWTMEKLETLKRLCGTTMLRAEDIGNEIGCSKKAIITACNYYGIELPMGKGGGTLKRPHSGNSYHTVLVPQKVRDNTLRQVTTVTGCRHIEGDPLKDKFWSYCNAPVCISPRTSKQTCWCTEHHNQMTRGSYDPQ